MTKMGDGDKVSVVTNTGTINDVDCLLWAIGRVPNVGDLHLDRVVSVDTMKTRITLVCNLGTISYLWDS